MQNDPEYRMHQRLQNYWESLRGGRRFPSENDVNPDDIADIWGSCFLISIDDVTRRIGYRYSYLGEELIQAYGDDSKNPDMVMQMMSTANVPIMDKFDEVVKQRQPVVDESEFVNLKHLNI